MSSAPTADEIARDATWLAQALDPAQGLVRLVAMDRDSYRAASFLDDRLLQIPVDAQPVSWTLVEDAMAADLRSDARWIFHIGHVGSTLVSRLLGEIHGVLAVREPRLLRDLALTPADIRERYVALAPKLMSRTFAEDETACVKATSFASEIAPELVPAGGRALFMYATPRHYVASILAGENSVHELRALAGNRAQRLNGRGIYLPAQNDAEFAAVAWAAGMTDLEAAAEAMTDRRIGWEDFDVMLTDMGAGLTRAAELFGYEVSAERLRAIAAGPLMTRYSKAQEYEYSSSLRREIIGETIEQHGRAIDAALAMLDRAAEKSALLGRALARAGET
jgi:hypothetical protein